MPKSRARLHKVDAYLSLFRLMRVFFSGSQVRRVGICPIDTFEPSNIFAPCAFTVIVRVSSEIGLLSAPCARTATETFTMTR